MVTQASVCNEESFCECVYVCVCVLFAQFNARSETVADKFVFSSLLRKQRCVFLCNGWYEWLKQGSKKQPYYIHVGEERVVMMAGLYDQWQGDCNDDAPLQTFTILTADSSKPLSWLHNRMPVILSTDEATEAWLSGQPLESREFNQQIAVSYDGPDLQWHEVTPELGKLRTQGPQCSKPLNQGRNIAALFGKVGTDKAAQPESLKPPAVASNVKADPDDCTSPSRQPHRSPTSRWKSEDGNAETLQGQQSPPLDPSSGQSLPLNPDDKFSDERADEKGSADGETNVGSQKRTTEPNLANCGPPKRAVLFSPGKAGTLQSPRKRAKPDNTVGGQTTMNNFFSKK